MALTGVRKEFGGNAKPTTLSGLLPAGTLSFSVATGGAANWPTGASYPFVVVIDRGLGSEEKILCASRSGDTFTVTTRGYDGTSNQDHAAGAKVEHAVDSIVFADLHRHLYDTTEDQHTQYLLTAEGDARYPVLSTLTAKGMLYVATASGTVAGVAAGTDGSVLVADSGQSAGVRYALPATATVATAETTTLTSFGDLPSGTVGPAVSVAVGASGMVRVTIGARMRHSAAGGSCFMSFAVSGATTRAPQGTYDTLLATVVNANNYDFHGSKTILLTGLTPGTNTLTAKYSVTTGTGTFQYRDIIAEPR